MYWSGGFNFDLNERFTSPGGGDDANVLGLNAEPTGGFVDLQALFYAWIYNSTGAYTLPTPMPCLCTDENGNQTDDFRKCGSAL